MPSDMVRLPDRDSDSEPRRGASEEIPRFLADGGEMGARVRSFDWSTTPLGSPPGWPQSLRTAVRLLLSSRHPMFIWWGPDLIQFYNDAYRDTMGPERHPSSLGQRGRECWDEIWDIIGPQIELVMRGEGATWYEDHLVPVTRHGRREDVWWTYGFSPIDEEGQPHGVGGVLVVCRDVTSEHVAREALRAAEASWRAIFENMHEGFSLCEVVRDAHGVVVDFRYLQVNAAFERLTGIPPERVVGRLATEAIPGVEQFWTDTYARVVETGEPVHFEYRVEVLKRWFEVLAYRTEPDRFAALFLNVTDRKASEERQALLSAEVDHRAKNALSVVQAAVRLTRAPDLASYRRALEGRITALARAQSLLSDNQWKGASLRTLLHGELGAFLGDGASPGPKAELKGADVALPASATQPLAMAVHELATNAVKYGALSTPRGRVTVAWHVEAMPSQMLMLRWAESGGPSVVAAPSRRGFGSRVLDGTIREQLAGEVSIAWEPSGIVCEIAVPLASHDAHDEKLNGQAFQIGHSGRGAG
jgi:PAS domain S-box-containing protein